MPTIALPGTLDTKLHEFLYLRRLILSKATPGTEVMLIDVGRSLTSHPDISISHAEILRYAPSDNSLSEQQLGELPRGEVIKHLTICLTNLLHDLHQQRKIHACISAGGSGGSSLTAAAMRLALPTGFPKLLVSTIASGDVNPLVDGSDLIMMYSIVDIAGWNDVLEKVFTQAAGAITGMALSYQHTLRQANKSGITTATPAQTKHKIRLGITMFGVTTPCVEHIRAHLDDLSAQPAHKHEYEIYVFHATGTGGKAMERMIDAVELDAVLDVTTTEVADFLVGGNMSAGEKRLEAAARGGLPCVVSLGAVDMVNFGPKSTVPPQFAERKLYEHNAAVTLMRTTAAENRQIGSFIAEKLRNFAVKPRNIRVLLPLGAVSMLSASGQAFEDKEADEACFSAIRERLQGSDIEVIEDEREIND